MNSVTLIGRLTTDLEMYHNVEKGTVVGKFRIAVDNKDKEKTTEFINIVAFNKVAELLKEYTKKGDLLALRGRLHNNEYIKDDIKRTKTEVIIEDFTFIQPKQ